MCAYMGRNTKMAQREANRQKEGRWGPPGPSPLKQVITIALQLVDDDLIVKPVVVDVSLVCTSSDSLLDELVVVPIDYLPSITAEVVICEPLALFSIDLANEYLVVGPLLPSNNSNLIDSTLKVAETVDLWSKKVALFVKEHYTLSCNFFHQKVVNILVNVWVKWYLAIIYRFLICYFFAPDFIRNGIG